MVTAIHVTQKDIDLGFPDDPCNCPIARAARRRFGVKCWFAKWSEGKWRLKIVGGDFYIVHGASVFAVQFDRRERVEPRKFKLEKV